MQRVYVAMPNAYYAHSFADEHLNLLPNVLVLLTKNGSHVAVDSADLFDTAGPAISCLGADAEYRTISR
jgi:hypothetical protein